MGYKLFKDWSLPEPEPVVNDELIPPNTEVKVVKYYTSYVQGIKTYLKSLPKFKNKHKLIDTEMDKNETRRVVVRRAIIKFKKQHL